MTIDIQSLQKEITKQKNIIEDSSVKTEREFVLIGSRLFGINSFSKDINEISSKITDMFQSGKIDTTLEEISSQNDIINSSLLDSLSNFKSIEPIIAKIYNLLKSSQLSLRIYEKIKTKLNMLSVLIKIESSWLDTDNDSFTFLSDSIGELNQSISFEIDKVNIEIKNILIYLSDARNKLIEIIENLNKTTEEINIKINSSTIRFIDEVQYKEHQLVEIKGNISSIFRNINNVITLSQVQDSTKQRMDHIIQAFDGLALLSENDETSRNYYEKNLKIIQKTIQIERDQISSTNMIFLDSTTEILNFLKDISKMSLMVKSQMKEILSTSGKDGEDNILGSIIKEIVPLSKELSLNVKSSQSIFEFINSLLSRLAIISNFTNKINQISERLDLLSINSILKASRLGKNGASISVLSEEIKSLSVTSHQEMINITAKIDNILKEVQILNKMYVNSESNDRFIKIEDSLTTITDKLGVLAEYNNSINTNVDELFEQISFLDNEIKTLIPQINIHHNLDVQVETILHEFNVLLNKIEKYNFTQDENELLKDNEFLAELKNHYTMDSERVIYKNHMKNLISTKPNLPKLDAVNNLNFVDSTSMNNEIEIFIDVNSNNQSNDIDNFDLF